MKELVALFRHLTVPNNDDHPEPEATAVALQIEDRHMDMSGAGSAGEFSPTPNPRCWTTGQAYCGCPAYASPYNKPDQPYDDGMDVACETDCPLSESEEEQKRKRREEYSPCCGPRGCICTKGQVDWNGTVNHRTMGTV